MRHSFESIFPRSVLPRILILPILRLVAGIGLLASLASACSGIAGESSSAESTHSAETLAMMITNIAIQNTEAPSPSPTSYALPENAPTATAGPTATRTVIATVELSSPSPYFRRATYAGSTPTTNPASLLTRTLTGRCNAAFFVGDVAPIFENSMVKAGASFVKTWAIRNAGTCTWYPSYLLYWHSGAHFEGPDYIDFPEIVAPNDTLFLSLNLMAPSEPGKYYSRWYIRDPEFTQFGIGAEYSDPLMIRIIVVA